MKRKRDKDMRLFCERFIPRSNSVHGHTEHLILHDIVLRFKNNIVVKGIQCRTNVTYQNVSVFLFLPWRPLPLPSSFGATLHTGHRGMLGSNNFHHHVHVDKIYTYATNNRLLARRSLVPQYPPWGRSLPNDLLDISPMLTVDSHEFLMRWRSFAPLSVLSWVAHYQSPLLLLAAAA